MNQRVLRISLVVLLAVSIGLAWWSRDQWTTEAIVAWVAGLGVWGPLVFVGETCKRLELLGTLTPRRDGLG